LFWPQNVQVCYNEVMATKVPIDVNQIEQLRKQLQETGEVRVEDTQGVPLVLMTIDARGQLHRLVYDVSDAEMMAMGSDQLNDPEGWGAEGMEVYDTMEGTDPSPNGNS